jgi:MerR family mercuric resistance operon transcriptional regulator
MKSQKITIAVAARLADVGIETIRYYQRKGLIEEPVKPVEGYRVYPEQTIARIRFIKRAQQLGFTLREITNLLQLDATQCAETQAMAQQKLRIIEDKLAGLQSIKKTLVDLIAHCNSSRADEGCPIIYSISQPSLKL